MSVARFHEGSALNFHWWQILLSTAAALLVLYVVLLILLWRYAARHPGTVSLGDALRLLPDMLKFVGRLTLDKNLSWRPRIAAMLLVVYLASPVDLIPDFVPLLGYADDVLITALVLRLVLKSSGDEALERHWNGSVAGLEVIQRLAGCTPNRRSSIPTAECEKW